VDDLYDEPVVLGDMVVEKLLAALAADERWDGLTARFWDAVDEYMRETAPAAVKNLVAAEVTRQLEKMSQTAAVRGKPSSVAHALVAVEVTTQLRDKFAPLVERALDQVGGQLQQLAADLLQDALRKKTAG